MVVREVGIRRMIWDKGVNDCDGSYAVVCKTAYLGLLGI